MIIVLAVMLALLVIAPGTGRELVELKGKSTICKNDGS
jgi:hypothetical protein